MNPTPGTFQSTLKHGSPKDDLLCLIAVAEKTKPAALLYMGWSWLKSIPEEYLEGLLFIGFDSDSIVVLDSPEGRENALSLMEALGKFGDEKRRALGEALGYRSEEIEEFMEMFKEEAGPFLTT